MKRFLLCITAAFLCAFPCPASALGAVGGAGRSIVLTEGWNGRTVEARVGDELRIELPVSGGTGYSWYFTDLDRDLLEPAGEETRSDGKEAPGSPVTGIWILRVIHAGNGTIRMSYYRIWEGKERAATHFEVTLEVVP